MAYTGKGGAVNDLVLLDDLSEQTIIENLRSHHSHKEIYTYIGPVLLSVNPYTDISNLYSKAKIKKYTLKNPIENAPHVFALSEVAYRSMVSNLTNEAIVITGESGSGKTEASKRVMQYVAAMSSKSREVQRIKDQLLQSNPLLESFGNAKTIRNDNSSRFGKFMEILFLVGDPAGGKITTYLLEKSRVVKQSQGERNFHIFYELLALRKARNYGLTGRVEDYNFLCDANADTRDIDDAGNFEDVVDAMNYVQISKEEQDSIFKTVAFILHIGNVDFDSNGNIRNPDVVRTAADLLQVKEMDLTRALQHKTLKTGLGKTSTNFDKQTAIYSRDSLAQSVYQALFNFIVEAANVAIKAEKHSTSLGVLDIYGFEILGVNGFEQLCINYTNEKLHQLFIEMTLRAEQKEYQKEGIQWEKVKYEDNKDIVVLFEKDITRIINDATTFSGAKDMSVYEKIKQLKDNKRIKQIEFAKRSKPGQFSIRHYAGAVLYGVEGFVDRNNDKLSPDIVQLLNKAGDKVVNGFFKTHMNARASIKVYKKMPTASTQYKQSVANLIDNLKECSQHYIRCIKPNEEKRAGLFDDELVRTQVRYLGILENVKVRRAGYAFRMTFDRFAAKYKCVLSNVSADDLQNNRAVVERILKKYASGERYEMGKTKVFIKKASSILKIEAKRQDFLTQAFNFLPPEETIGGGGGVLFADRVQGFDAKFVKKDLIFVVGAKGLYWYNANGDVAQYFPLEKLDFIGMNESEKWMTIHISYPSKIEGEKVDLTYLSEGIYAANVEKFAEVLRSMGFDSIQARKVTAYPADAVEQIEYKKLVKNIAKGEKDTVQKGKGNKKKFKFPFPKISFLSRMMSRKSKKNK
eukprot:augustus_masked-scaffold_5-processed-gene-17.17-mRNA-1 protein AED:0.03 eAED:0.03 QI:0/-1/0/1/-1/1/1/0/859